MALATDAIELVNTLGIEHFAVLGHDTQADGQLSQMGGFAQIAIGGGWDITITLRDKGGFTREAAEATAQAIADAIQEKIATPLVVKAAIP